MKFIAKKPFIHVELLVKDQKLSRIQLKKLSDQPGFTYSWVGQTPNEELEKQILDFLLSYSQKKIPLASNIPLKKPALNFFSLVLGSVSEIPFGHTKTYGDIAKDLNRPRSSRAVGFACHQNAFPLLIPCHRVVAANGHLGGFATGTDVKEELLNFEKT